MGWTKSWGPLVIHPAQSSEVTSHRQQGELISHFFKVAFDYCQRLVKTAKWREHPSYRDLAGSGKLASKTPYLWITKEDQVLLGLRWAGSETADILETLSFCNWGICRVGQRQRWLLEGTLPSPCPLDSVISHTSTGSNLFPPGTSIIFAQDLLSNADPKEL